MEFQKEPGRIFALGEDGKLLAEITFPTGEDGVADIDHTFVDESLRGQGVASQLVRAAAAELRAQGKRAKTSCWYAAQWRSIPRSRTCCIKTEISKSVILPFTAWTQPDSILCPVR